MTALWLILGVALALLLTGACWGYWRLTAGYAADPDWAKEGEVRRW